MENSQKNEKQLLTHIVYNKIYNENIKTYEQLAYEGKEYLDRVLETNAILETDIEKAIEANSDLNRLNNLDMKKYTQTDLNGFLKQVLLVRQYEIKDYVFRILKDDQNLFLDWIPFVLDCLTYKEGIEIKKAFLRKLFRIPVSIVEDDKIDAVFCENFLFLLMEKEFDKKALHF